MFHVKYAAALRLMADVAYPIAFTPFLVFSSMREYSCVCLLLPVASSDGSECCDQNLDDTVRL